MASSETISVESARIRLGHAAVGFLASTAGLDVIHIKGYALDPSLRWEGRESSDVDVLVRPEHLESVLSGLYANGWKCSVGFEAGSPFGHAATLRHASWGSLDVHRLIPGFSVRASEAFELLWRDRASITIAGLACPVPSLPAQRLIQLLHAARSDQLWRRESDVATCWRRAALEDKAAVRALAHRLGADVALAAAIGELDAYRGHRDYPIWKSVSEGDTRLGEWWARIRSAPTAWNAVQLAFRAPLVNVEHLAVRLGHPPTTHQIVGEFFARPMRGVIELLRSGTRPEGP